MIMDGTETGLMDVFDALRHTTMLFMFRCVRPLVEDKGGNPQADDTYSGKPVYDLEFTEEEKPFVSSKNLFRDFVCYLMARCISLSYKAFEEVLTGPFMENGMSCACYMSLSFNQLTRVFTEDFIKFFPGAFGIICEEWFDYYFHKALNEDIVGDDKTLRDAFFEHGGKTTDKPFIDDPRFGKVLDFIGQLLE